ncbi:MAG TPA: aminomethyl-transferring glycine dehydrogenase subunit GcvPA [Dehalococcoidales bacterium]|nr:aminomethyl-transferring glycine dehydrogenase subunit GcvPA [Dehalococcoidales bacterium]
MPSPYVPNTDQDRAAMLHDIGAGSIDELFQDVPAQFRNATFDLPLPLTELELREELYRLSRQNASPDDYACFLGAGYYHHFIPAVVGHITGRSELYTAYTPYQAEASQGILQAIYEYQSLVCQLTGMEISNAGMYDGSSAAAEAALMACRITGKKEVAVLSTVNPAYREVMGTYGSGQGITIHELKPDFKELSSKYACLIVQQPNFLGYFEKVERYAKLAHGAGALLIAIFDPISLGLLQPPGNYGADIAIAEGQPLGNPLSFGGPGLGIFTCRKEHLRQMPGRVVGRTTDVEGQPGYVLTVATREQHIRRERATSNICTNEALVALAATVYLAAMGKSGLRRVAELCYHKAHYAANAISKLKRCSLASEQPFFKEFVIRCPVPPEKINRILLKEKIIGGLDVSHLVDKGMLFCVTEMNSKKEIDRLVAILEAL